MPGKEGAPQGDQEIIRVLGADVTVQNLTLSVMEIHGVLCQVRKANHREANLQNVS